ncbi:MAG: hypothetical protein ACREO9_00025, partial [Lysobacterales bacterium]
IERDTLPEGTARPVVHGLRRYADAMIIGALLLTVIFLLLRQSDWIEGESGPPVIGVLPFTELGAEDDAYFGAGLADTLSYKLGLLKQLIVLAPSSTFEFRGQGLDLKAVGLKLGATALLEGTVRRASGLLRVNARLVDITSGQQLWSGSYDRSGTDLFAVQDEIAGAVTEALQVVLSPDDTTRLAKPSTLSLTAYDAYLLGQAKLADRRRETIGESIAYFHRAIELDPSYALAHAALAESIFLTNTYRFWESDWDQQGPEAHRAAATALSLDPQLGEGYLAQAFAAMGDNDFGKADTWPAEHIRALLKRAVELSPNDATALKFYATYLESPDEQMEMLQRAARLEPRSGIIRANIAEQYIKRRAFEEARDWFLQSATATKPHYLDAYKFIIEMYQYDAGQLDVAARWGKAFVNAHPEEWRAHVGYARTLLDLGAFDEERRVIEAFPEDNESDSFGYFRFAFLMESARLAARAGDNDKVDQYARTFSRHYFETLPEWPNLSSTQVFTVMLDYQALADIHRGQPESALERYRLALPDPADWMYENLARNVLRTPVLFAILQRLTDDPESADRGLREFLERISGKPITSLDGIGFTRFAIHAFLGETDAAIVALQEALDAGWLAGWWGLKSGDFDPNYAAVIADPRFVTLYAEIEARVKSMREDFFAHPELPEGQKVL